MLILLTPGTGEAATSIKRLLKLGADSRRLLIGFSDDGFENTQSLRSQLRLFTGSGCNICRLVIAVLTVLLLRWPVSYSGYEMIRPPSTGWIVPTRLP